MSQYPPENAECTFPDEICSWSQQGMEGDEKWDPNVLGALQAGLDPRYGEAVLRAIYDFDGRNIIKKLKICQNIFF